MTLQKKLNVIDRALVQFNLNEVVSALEDFKPEEEKILFGTVGTTSRLLISGPKNLSGNSISLVRADTNAPWKEVPPAQYAQLLNQGFLHFLTWDGQTIYIERIHP